MNFDAARPLVETLLYEGYALYPYRASAVKNRHRFLFGGLYPRAHAEAEGEAWTLTTQVLLEEGADPVVEARVRFLHLVERLDGDRSPGWQEAVEREVATGPLPLARLAAEPADVAFAFPGRAWRADGIARRQDAVVGAVDVAAAPLAPGGWRITTRVRNLTAFREGAAQPDRHRRRARALARALASTHVLLGAAGGAFASLVDPPPALAAEAAACRNTGVWPALVDRERTLVLASPIILPDHPALAPESPGDLFDATEIDELLTLRILTLTDGERAAARRLDARARALLDRTEALGPGALRRLHGAARGGGAPALRPGARVVLRPRERADVLDLALAGRTATVVSLEEDAEGGRWLAVSVDDDPGRDLAAAGRPGHRFFFRADEVEVLP